MTSDHRRPLDIVLERLPGAKLQGKEWQARCPCPNHGTDGKDRRASLSVTEGSDGRALLHCHAGCSQEQVVEALGLGMGDLYPNSGNGIPLSEIATAYDYRDEEGNLLFQVVRKHPKGFFQRRPGRNGRWINNLGNTRKVLYRLPELIKADPAEPIFIVEGERDADRLAGMGLVATTSSGGASKWRSEYASVFRDRGVVIIPDNDAPGRDYSERISRSLRGISTTTKVLKLPGLPPGGDVSDWLAKGGDRAQLLQLVEETPAEATKGNALPTILTSHRQLRDITEEVLEALDAANNPPRLFTRGGEICRIRLDERERLVIEVLTEHALRGEMERAANFAKVIRDETVPVAPPMSVVKDVQTRPKWNFPALEAVIQAPALRPDGTLLDQAGYDPMTRLVYSPSDSLELPVIPENPGRDDLARALALLDEAIQDFPFVDSKADRANTIALMLTPIVRPAIRGPVPLCGVDAPQKGTGKTLLAEMAATIATGRAEQMGGPKREEEWQKLITSTLVEGSSFVIFDNLRGTVRSAALERVLTAEYWADRILGHTKMVRLPQRVTCVATANNAQLGGDLSRRCYRIRLDAKCARPWTRRAFHHPDLNRWVLENRGRLLTALLTLARAWFVAGCPKAETVQLGKFEGWCEVIGGILAHAGVTGFLDNQEELYAEMDEDETDWEAFLQAWSDMFGSAPKTVAELIGAMYPESGGPSAGEALRVCLPGDLADVFSPGDDRRRRSSFAKRLGKAISSRKERRYGDDGLRISPAKDDSHRGVKRWRVVHDAGLAGVAGLISVGGETSCDYSFGEGEESISEPAESNPPNPETRTVDSEDFAEAAGKLMDSGMSRKAADAEALARLNGGESTS